MARADTITMIPLDRIAFYLGIDPYHFNGIYTELHVPNPDCDDVWYQFDWQYAGKLSRETLAGALRQAEDIVTEYLNWTPIPCWFEEEQRISQYYKSEVYSNVNSRGGAKSIISKYGYILEVGERASVYVSSPVTAFSDENGDGYDETVTITFATDVTEESELHVYYPDKDGRDEWEIRPLDDIVIAGGVATITFQRYLIPLEDLVALMPEPDNIYHIGIDGDEATNFLPAVDVYRVYTDTSSQASLYYAPPHLCTNCEHTTYDGCLFVRDGRLGVLSYSAATFNDTSGLFSTRTITGMPSKVRIKYRAGWTDQKQKFPQIRMDQTLERMICFFALSILTDVNICGCTNTRRLWQYMVRDLAEDTGERRYTMPWQLMGNPLGSSVAAVALWRHIQPLRLARGPNVLG